MFATLREWTDSGGAGSGDDGAVCGLDPLLSMEAMKMATMLTVERDATGHAVHVRTGETVNAKDLLLELR